jgi:mxaA protein
MARLARHGFARAAALARAGRACARALRVVPASRLSARALACVLAALALGAPAAEPADAIVDQPRPFGHAIGDVLTQRVLLVDAGHGFEPAALPGPSRLGVWFERRNARIEQAADGRRWLLVEYQIVNAPRETATIRLPAWELEGAAGARALRVPAWNLVLAPLAPPAPASGAEPDLRPDHPPPAIDAAAIRRRLAATGLALCAVLVAWAAWLGWRAWRAARSQPFARALLALRGQAADTPAAWRTLHEAFDRTAGEVARPATLARLFERAPHLQPLRARIEGFYARSQARFFGDVPAAGLPPDGESPLALCRALRRLERRAER